MKGNIMTKRNIPKFKRHPISRKLRKAYKPTEAMAEQHQQVVDETYSRFRNPMVKS